ncbi:MAG: hypothetical protein LCH61_02860 [Proteobacteria bacterium]|nr:hypothetical protein [Pseudomonadota bacterium]
MTELRLIADDLTGALDSAAAFASVIGPQRVVWQEGQAGSVFNTGTREVSEADAARRLHRLALFLAPAPDRLGFFKVDSLLRGHAGVELAAVLGQVPFDHVIIAPAIPFQGRVTRQGRQYARVGDSWTVTGEDLAARLRGQGYDVMTARAGDALPRGICLWDAETMDDLDAIVGAGRAARGRVLWVGAAGLAAALAGASGAVAVAPRAPLLGLIGTNHPIMRGQLAAVQALSLARDEDVRGVVEDIEALLASDGVAFVNAGLTDAADRGAVQAGILRRIAGVLGRVTRPGALFVSGGETLSGVATALGAVALDVFGVFEPGIPASRLIGGRWDGLTVFSKSGAFGAPDVLSRLVASLVPDSKETRP